MKITRNNQYRLFYPTQLTKCTRQSQSQVLRLSENKNSCIKILSYFNVESKNMRNSNFPFPRMSVIVGCPSTFFLLALKLETIWLSFKALSRSRQPSVNKVSGVGQTQLYSMPWMDRKAEKSSK